MASSRLLGVTVLSPHGEVKLLAHMGSDLDIVNAAKVSFDKQSEEFTDREDGILRFLLKNRHGSPFEHTHLRWYVEAPIFVFREWHRHRAGWSYNEHSARYSEMPTDYFTPNVKDIRQQVGKPGAYTYEPMANEEDAWEAVSRIIESQADSFYQYRTLLEMGVAKEIARTVLPVGTMSRMWASCNVRSMLHFFGLRSQPDAQQEIRAFSLEMERQFEEVFPRTYAHFIANGRVSP